MYKNPQPYFGNIEKETVDNKNYRKVLYTAQKMQLVVMSLKVGEEIPEEVHPHTNQFIRVEKGRAYIRIAEKEFVASEDEVVIIPCGSKHYVKNDSNDEVLKLYTIYTPIEHNPGTIHKTFKEALKEEHNK